MKKIFPALAMLLSVASAHAAPLFTFDLTATGFAADAEVYSSVYTSFNAIGKRQNESTTYIDEVSTYGSFRYVWHYADVSYEQFGSYRDRYDLTVSNDLAIGPDSYLYVSGNVSYDPARLAGYANMSSFAYAFGTYTTTPNPRFPSVGMTPAGITFAAAQSTNPANLAAEPGHTSFGTDGTFFSYFDKEFTIADGSAELGLLLYVGQNLTTRSFTVGVNGQEYDTGLYQFTERQYLSFEIMPVPEPSTWAMLLAGAGVLAMVRRRRAN